MRAFKKFDGNSYELDRVQDNIDIALSPVLGKEIINGRLIDNEEFTLGTTLKLQHKLNRTPRGFFVVKHPDGYRAEFLMVSADSKFINLTPQLFKDWTAYTPTLENASADTKAFFYKINGDSIKVRGHLRGNTALTGTFYFYLPTGISMDGTRVDIVGSYDILGTASAFDSGVGYYTGNMKISIAAQKLWVADGTGGTGWDATAPFVWAAADRLSVDVYDLPISGITEECSIWVF